MCYNKLIKIIMIINIYENIHKHKHLCLYLPFLYFQSNLLIRVTTDSVAAQLV
jgi:hypothetical protein